MSIAVALKHMLAAGMTPEAICAAVAEMEAAALSARVETARDRKRAYDRKRMATMRDNARQTATNGDNDDTPPFQGFQVSPTPPSNLPNHPPLKNPLKGVKKSPQSDCQIAESRLLDHGLTEGEVAEWKAIRKAKRSGPITKTVVDGLEREAGLAGWPVPKAVRECIERGWQGFRADWVADKRQTGPPSHPRKPDVRDALNAYIDRIESDETSPGSPESPSAPIRLLAATGR